MRGFLVLSLALIPPLIAAAWTWIQMRKADKELSAMGDFEGIHFEK